MTQTASSNVAQIEYWNTKAGETWAKQLRYRPRKGDPSLHLDSTKQVD
jgi:hypothetical protein